MYKVMIADDEPIMRKALSTLTDWESMDCRVVYMASNGLEVLEKIQDTMPDILVTDIKMPGCDGIGLAGYIWEHKLPVKVIVLTAYADFSYAQSAVKYGVSDYVIKTGMFDGLSEAIENAKRKIEEEKIISAEDRELLLENTLKAIFDGSLYDEDEIKERFRQIEMTFTRYFLVLVQFHTMQTGKKRKRKYVFNSLANFLNMVFDTQKSHPIPVEKDCFAILLGDVKDDSDGMIREKCEQIVDTMENFMGFDTFVSLSLPHYDETDLKGAYDEAMKTLKEALAANRKIALTQNPKLIDGRQSLVEACIKYIETHYESCVQVSEIAREIGTSSSYLSRVFKESTGQTIIATLNEKKLEAAIGYLKDSDLKIYEIANRLGFENTTYFSHFFKKYMKMSPREFKGKE